MPRRKRSPWGKRATTIGLVLGLIANIPMNLLTAWFAEKVVINTLYLVFVILLIVAIIYSGRKMKTPEFLNSIFWFLLATVFVNLVSAWIQYSLLHDTFSFTSVSLFLAITVIILAIGALFQSHYYRRFKKSVIMKRRWEAKSISLASQGKKGTVKKVTKRMPPSKRKRI